MALSRERIADELLKMLGLPDPAPTVGIMLERGILKPVLPEIEPRHLPRLQALIAAEQEAEVEPAPLRRLAVLLPPSSEMANQVAIRLKLSNKARKRLASAASPLKEGSPEALAYRAGTEVAVDTLLLASRPGDASRVANWAPPRLPIRGGALIARGLPEGPIVARTLRQIEDHWVEAGFPAEAGLEEIVADAIRSAQE
jgi:poly(A) polymerase